MPDAPDTPPQGDAAGRLTVGALLLASARGACPVCVAPALFESAVGFAPRCRVCGADFGRYNVGDGPAAILTLLVGAIILALALSIEFAFRPPLWVHLILWLPLTFGAVVGSLRVAKAMLLQLEHRNAAGEAGRKEPGP